MARVWVTGIPDGLAEKEFERVMRDQTRGVQAVRLVINEQGRSSGTAFVTYSSEPLARQAVATQVLVGAGKALSLRLAGAAQESQPQYRRTFPSAKRRRPGPAGPPTGSVALSGFPERTTDEELRALLSSHGEVLNLTVTRQEGAPPHALAEMADAGMAADACALLDDTLWRGAQLRVEPSYPVARTAPTPEGPPTVDIVLDPNAHGNHRITVGQLLLMLAPIVDAPDKDPGIFVDRNGHVVIPVEAFEGDDDGGEEDADGGPEAAEAAEGPA
eukprot:TRINITY_DN65133_c0_g1_i1.p1 TRINITY_DN65133_c0_g1~~TRINITY_DN65133_c0_g1_i1.p1  ORF type:complete len:273 (+),score=58.08 TRINITY_DN65133_c0_g1_i1:113-931(+)